MQRSPYHAAFQAIDDAFWNNVVTPLDNLLDEIRADEDGFERAYKTLGECDDEQIAEKAVEDYDAYQQDLDAIADLLEKVGEFHRQFENFTFQFKGSVPQAEKPVRMPSLQAMIDAMDKELAEKKAALVRRLAQRTQEV